MNWIRAMSELGMVIVFLIIIIIIVIIIVVVISTDWLGIGVCRREGMREGEVECRGRVR
jgi:hypothetical protein